MISAWALIVALALFVGFCLGVIALFFWIINWPVGPRF